MLPKLYNDIANGVTWPDSMNEPSNDPKAQITYFHDNTVLHVAAMFGNTTFAERILGSRPPLALAQTPNARGDTALHIAARLGDLTMVELLERILRASMGDHRLRIENNEKNTALHEAVLGNSFEVVDFLIGEDPELTALVNANNESALFLAVDRQFLRIAGRIMETQSYSVQGRNGFNAMQAATIRSRDSNIWQRIQESIGQMIFFHIPLFLMKAKDIIAFCKTVLALLVRMVCIVISALYPFVTILLWRPFCGLTFNRSNFRKEDNLTINHKLMNARGAEILRQQDKFGWTTLHYAAHFGEIKLVNQILQSDNRQTAYLRDSEGMTALHIAARDGQVEVASSLLESCPDLSESIDNKSRTALHVAVESRNQNVVKIFVRNKAFNHLVNERDVEGNTALHLAATCGHYGIVELLTSDKRLDRGAINNIGMTALGATLSDPRLNASLKALILSMLQMRGVYPSLETGVVRKMKITEEIHVRKGFRGIIEMSASTSGSPSSSTTTKEDINKSDKHSRIDQIKTVSQVNLLVATIICSLTFSAAIAMPGGFGSSDGMANLRKKDAFKMFLIFDSMAFGLAASSMLLHFIIGFMSVVDAKMYNKYPFDCVAWLTIFSIVSAVLAFYFGTSAVLWQDYGDSPFPGIITATCFVLPLLYFFIANSFETVLLQFYFPAIYMK